MWKSCMQRELLLTWNQIMRGTLTNILMDAAKEQGVEFRYG